MHNCSKKNNLTKCIQELNRAYKLFFTFIWVFFSPFICAVKPKERNSFKEIYLLCIYTVFQIGIVAEVDGRE